MDKLPFNKKILIAIIMVVGITGASLLVYFLVFYDKSNDLPDDNPIFKGGTITQNETWSGNIFVNESIFVPTNVTLTILPGTSINFKPDHNYKNPNKLLFGVVEGTVIANGTPNEQIWFTSDADDPINGDWAGIELYNTNTSIFNYVIIEYTVLGIAQFESSATISHSIIRWANSEGIYMEQSSPLIENNLLYQNGYHEIAIEQYNYDVEIRNNIFAGGTDPFISIDSNVTLEGNYFYNYNKTDVSAVQVAGVSNATVTGNRFEGFDNATAILLLTNSSTLNASNNDFGDGFIPIPTLGFEDMRRTELGYTPGAPEDQFMYVYPAVDETRQVLKRIGQGLGFGWAVEYANGYVWKLESGKIHKINPLTSAYTTYSFNESDLAGPKGLCYDGEFFWANDHSLLKVVKFKVNDTDFIYNSSFIIPESGTGGRQGIATDGTYLYLSNRAGTKLFELNKSGTIHRTIDLGGIDLYSPFTWNGTHFWAPGPKNTLMAFTKDGVIEGRIYDVAGGVLGMSWDGNHLWGIYRTCETWNDSKIFQIEILNGSIISTEFVKLERIRTSLNMDINHLYPLGLDKILYIFDLFKKVRLEEGIILR